MGHRSLHAAFPDGRFEPPASLQDIARAEDELGVSFPDSLRELYLEANGFCEPRGNAGYLLPLDSLVSTTQFWWRDFAKSWPDVRLPDLLPFVFFGSSSCDHYWAIRCEAPHDIIAWHHQMIGDGFESAGADIISLYRSDFAEYDKLD